jgi:hypothetical protein
MSEDESRLSHDPQLAELDAAIARGIAAADAGRVKPAAEVFDRLEAKYRAMAGDGQPIPSQLNRSHKVSLFDTLCSQTLALYAPTCGGIVRNALMTWNAMRRLFDSVTLWATCGRMTN